ncbi:MAG: nitroreductase family deazaflavin-dependent oxidoreductase, partial [Deltaproteobacteria bacterium]|nr:nitroreductase family deazaflavin-dependent oxidoreductase [Deltaproteobacteria bacterium]
SYLLTVPGRKIGRLYTTPVSLIEAGSKRWPVSPYGEVNWVLNARAASQVTLTRGGLSETVAIVEQEPHESAPVVQKYIVQEPSQSHISMSDRAIRWRRVRRRPVGIPYFGSRLRRPNIRPPYSCGPHCEKGSQDQGVVIWALSLKSR